MEFTQIPVDTFEKLQLNAGIVVDEFDPEDGTFDNILGATTGGINFSTNPTYEDIGSDVDNAPPNTKQLKRLMSVDPTMSGTFLTCSPALIKMLVGAGTVFNTYNAIFPRENLLDADFTDVWWVGDYTDKNTGSNAGFIAIHIKNALNTTGFQIQSGKDAKGQMAFEFHGHYDIDDQSDIPFEIYCKAGTTSAASGNT